MKVEPLTFSTEEAAAAIGVSSKFLREQMLGLGVPHLRLGSKLIFPRDALARWINEQAVVTGNNSKDGQHATTAEPETR